VVFVTFQPCEPPAPGALHLLLAPLGQLSGDGLLRELIAERRDRRGTGVEIWCLPPPALTSLLPDLPTGQDGVVVGDPVAITWLQLRIGGAVSTAALDPEWLQAQARVVRSRGVRAAGQRCPA